MMARRKQYQKGSPIRFHTYDSGGRHTGSGAQLRQGLYTNVPVGPQFTQLEMFINPKEMDYRSGYQPHNSQGRSPARTKGFDTREAPVLLDAPHQDNRHNKHRGVSVVEGQKTINSATGKAKRENAKSQLPVQWKSRANNPEWTEAGPGDGPYNPNRYSQTPMHKVPSQSEQRWADARIAVKGQMELPGMEAHSKDPVKRLMHNPAVERMNKKI